MFVPTRIVLQRHCHLESKVYRQIVSKRTRNVTIELFSHNHQHCAKQPRLNGRWKTKRKFVTKLNGFIAVLKRLETRDRWRQIPGAVREHHMNPQRGRYCRKALKIGGHCGISKSYLQSKDEFEIFMLVLSQKYSYTSHHCRLFWSFLNSYPVLDFTYCSNVAIIDIVFSSRLLLVLGK